MEKRFEVLFEKDEDGGFIAFVPALPGCYSQGDTLKEAKANIKEAIELYLETVKQRKGKVKSNFVSVEEIVVHA
ncbi:MAG: type II toxin-antitoxin system HicB family antitoxin [Candidatus Diapherotrites archaeon]|uniref:Type II toxin-antitoxin system HicB family antitoxin n=1 Tax=Candidatus Iainarchaeum sp. TaxID=3101447 RepID=A0A938YWA2_9ARCH|nr:type II toxin-antitoxin system HicB family antitoxin [Candidatus Diapherotrites archaeon]